MSGKRRMLSPNSGLKVRILLMTSAEKLLKLALFNLEANMSVDTINEVRLNILLLNLFKKRAYIDCKVEKHFKSIRYIKLHISSVFKFLK